MWIASGVRRLTSRRRKIRFAASTSAVVISCRYADRAAHVSRLKNASCPSSRVRSCVRTRRPTAEENSATLKSLTTTISGCDDKKGLGASARRVNDKQGDKDAGIKIKGSLFSFIPHLAHERAGVSLGHGSAYPTRTEPFDVGFGNRTRHGPHRLQLDDRLAAAGDDNPLTLQKRGRSVSRAGSSPRRQYECS
jgi:hypothetical protein